MTRAIVNTENRDYPDGYAGTGDIGSPVLGTEIINQVKTTVTPAGDGRNGFRIERTIGGGAWDAGAVSRIAVPNDSLLCIRFGSGDYMVGLSLVDPALSSNYLTIRGFATLANVLYIYSGGNQVGAGRGAVPLYGFCEFDDATNEIRLYTGATEIFAEATLMHTLTAMNGSAVWFDCSLNSNSADFEAYLIPIPA